MTPFHHDFDSDTACRPKWPIKKPRQANRAGFLRFQLLTLASSQLENQNFLWTPTCHVALAKLLVLPMSANTKAVLLRL